MSLPYEVRQERLRDCAGVGRMLRRSWMAAYREILGEDSVRTQTDAMFKVRWLLLANLLEGMTADRHRWVAVAGGRPIGFINWSEDHDGQAVVWMLYVDPEFHGHGIGTALLEAAMRRCLRARTIRLEVLQANTPAVDWYKRRGFDVFKEAPMTLSRHPFPVYYMDRPCVHWAPNARGDQRQRA